MRECTPSPHIAHVISLGWGFWRPECAKMREIRILISLGRGCDPSLLHAACWLACMARWAREPVCLVWPAPSSNRPCLCANNDSSCGIPTLGSSYAGLRIAGAPDAAAQRFPRRLRTQFPISSQACFHACCNVPPRPVLRGAQEPHLQANESLAHAGAACTMVLRHNAWS